MANADLVTLLADKILSFCNAFQNRTTNILMESILRFTFLNDNIIVELSGLPCKKAIQGTLIDHFYIPIFVYNSRDANFVL